MRKTYVLLAILLLVPSVSSALVGFGLEAGVGGWLQGDPGGTIEYQGGAIDLKDNLGYTGKARLTGRLKLKHPVPVLPNLYVMATPMSFESDEGVVPATVDFAGKPITIGVPISSKLNLDHYDVALFWGVPFLETATLGKFNIDWGLNARLQTLQAEIKQDLINFSEKTDKILAPIPMVYLAAQLKPIDLIGVDAEARLLPLGDNHYYSVIGRLKVKPLGPLFAGGGYRWDNIKVKSDDVKVDMTFKGPFVEAGIEF